MERGYKDSTGNRILYSSTGSNSIKRRLLTAIALIFLLAWIVSVIFTKLAAFNQSREFLKRQTAYTANTFLELAQNQPLNLKRYSGSETRALILWTGEKQVILQNEKISVHLRPHKKERRTIVKKIEGDNWIITSKCMGRNCIVLGLKDTERRYAIRWFLASIFLPLLVMLMISLVGIFYAIKYGMKPLDDLAKSVSKLNLNRLERLPKAHLSKELRPLSKAIDTLTTNMSKQLEQERTFLDACAHEIRTPVTGMISQLQVLMSKSTLDTNIENQLNVIERSAQRTARIANQFLSLARTNNSFSDKSNAIPFDLCELVRITIADLMSYSPDTDIQMLGDTSIWVKGEPFAIELIIQNLIDNSIKHSMKDESCKIHVTCKITKGNLIIRVEDNGIGIPTSQYNSLTDPFYRVTSFENQFSSKQKHIATKKGAGLGLNIVRKVVHTYAGEISFSKSETLQGLAVTISLNMIILQNSNDLKQETQAIQSHVYHKQPELYFEEDKQSS